jgi:hypothetical protein
MEKGDITHIILVLLAKTDGRTLERWTFDLGSSVLTMHPPKTTSTSSRNTTTMASDVAVPNVLKQIVAATTMLPDLPDPAVFTLQTYVANQLDGEEGEDLSRLGLIGDWKDVTDEQLYPFEAHVDVQQTALRGIQSSNRQVDLLLTSLDD